MTRRRKKTVVAKAIQPAASVVVTAPKPVTTEPLPRVTLHMFTQVCGIRQERLAGFLRKMKNQAPTKRTVADWHEAYKAYMDRPVRG